MIFSEIAERIARHIGVDKTLDELYLRDVLYVSLKDFWASTSVYGDRAEFNVNVRGGVIVSPPGYDALEAINLNSRPANIIGNEFEFLRNSVSIDCCGDRKTWSNQVKDLGYSPVLFQPNCQRIIVSSRAKENDVKKPAIQIIGKTSCGERIYTYRPKDSEKDEIGWVMNSCAESEMGEVKLNTIPIEGAVFPVTNRGFSYSNLLFSSISSIRKSDRTAGTVDVCVATDLSDGSTKKQVIASLGPFETESKYRSWKIPQICCRYPAVRALFRRSEPAEIVSNNQEIWVADLEALILMAKSKDMDIRKNDPVGAETYRRKAIFHLEQDSAKREPVSDQYISFNGPNQQDGSSFNFLNNSRL